LQVKHALPEGVKAALEDMPPHMISICGPNLKEHPEIALTVVCAVLRSLLDLLQQCS
jgi:hypothetical protein